MSLIISTESVSGIPFPNNENQFRLKVGPYTLRIDVREDDWKYDCHLVYNHKIGCEISILSTSSNSVLAKGSVSADDCRRGFHGVVPLRPRGEVTLSVRESDEVLYQSKVEKKVHSGPKIDFPKRKATPSVIGITSAPQSHGYQPQNKNVDPMSASPMISTYLNQAACRSGQVQKDTIVPGASIIIPVSGQQKELKELDSHQKASGAQVAHLDWRGINSVHITVFSCNNLAFGDSTDMILRCQIGEHARLSHVIAQPGPNPRWDTDFHYPSSRSSHCLNFDIIEVSGKTVIASCVLDLKSLIVSNKVRTWNGFLPLDVLGGSGNGSLKPMISAAVTLSKRQLSRAMVASPHPTVVPDAKYLAAKGIKPSAGNFRLVVEGKKRPKSGKGDDSSDVSNHTRKSAKVHQKHLETNHYQSISVILQSLSNIVDNHGKEPVSGFEVACGRVRAELPAQLVGRNVAANSKFSLPYSGNKYLRFVLKDQHGVAIATQKLNIERFLLEKDTGTGQKSIKLKAVDPANPIAKAHPEASIQIVLGLAQCHQPEVEMCPQPSIMITRPDGDAETLIEGMKKTVAFGTVESIKDSKTSNSETAGMLDQASFMMSQFKIPDIIESDDDEEGAVPINLSATFYDGMAEAEGFGFLRELNDLRHANERLGATVDLESEMKAGGEIAQNINDGGKDLSSSSSSSSSSSKGSKKAHRPANLLYSALDHTIGGDCPKDKTMTGASIAMMKQTATGLVQVEADEDSDHEENSALIQASHSFHSFILSADRLVNMSIPKGIDHVWVETKYSGHACPSFHQGDVGPAIPIAHCFEYPIEAPCGFKFIWVTIYGADTKSASIERRCIKLGQALLDLEVMIVAGSTDYEQSCDIYCLPDNDGKIDIGKTMLQKPTSDMVKMGTLDYSFELRNKVVLGPMAYPKRMSEPTAKVTTTLTVKEVTTLQQKTYRPPPMNAALLAGIRASGNKGTPAASSPVKKISSPSSPTTASPVRQNAPGPAPGGAPNMMAELQKRIGERAGRQKEERVFNAQMTTTDVIKPSNGVLNVTKMDLPNCLMVEVHGFKIVKQDIINRGKKMYIKFSYPDVSNFAKVKAKTVPGDMNEQGDVLFDKSKSKYPLPYDPDDTQIRVQIYEANDARDRGKVICEGAVMNLKDVWGKTMDKVISRRRIQMRHSHNLVAEAVCTFIFQTDPSMARKDFRVISQSAQMF